MQEPRDCRLHAIAQHQCLVAQYQCLATQHLSHISPGSLPGTKEPILQDWAATKLGIAILTDDADERQGVTCLELS